MTENFPFSSEKSPLWSDWTESEPSDRPLIPDPDSLHTSAQRRQLREFGVAEHAASAWLAARFEGPTYDLICMCGHPRKAHSESGACALVQPACGCESLVEAFAVEDCRYFYAQTLGPAGAHALSRGIVAATAVNAKVTRIISLACRTKDCHYTGNIWPVKLHKNGHPTLSGTPYERHVFLCEYCLIKKINR